MQVFIAGIGLVGSELVSQINSVKPPGLKLVGVANSRQMLLGDDITRERFKFDAAELNWADVRVLLTRAPSIFVDCTASHEIAQLYEGFLAAGVKVVTANKSLFSSPQSEFNKILPYSHSFFYEATCGAGLPVISTLKNLIATGDKVLKIEGVFSGTLSYIFSRLPFDRYSEAVATAKELGYTEPDPRDDLNGRDVMRKLIVLGRTAGLQLEPEDIQVESLVTEEQSGLTVDEFMASLASQDSEFSEKVAAADQSNAVLQYLAKLDFVNGVSSVVVAAVPLSSPIAHLSNGSNIFAFTTERYSTPLVIQGPGAGAKVTAAGVLGDILGLISSH